MFPPVTTTIKFKQLWVCTGQNFDRGMEIEKIGGKPHIFFSGHVCQLWCRDVDQAGPPGPTGQRREMSELRSGAMRFGDIGHKKRRSHQVGSLEVSDFS